MPKVNTAPTPSFAAGARRSYLIALDELYRVCLAMDADQESERPDESEYQAAMCKAARALGRPEPTWPEGSC